MGPSGKAVSSSSGGRTGGGGGGGGVARAIDCPLCRKPLFTSATFLPASQLQVLGWVPNGLDLAPILITFQNVPTQLSRSSILDAPCEEFRQWFDSEELRARSQQTAPRYHTCCY